jgi:PAS domain S-box-containing protein
VSSVAWILLAIFIMLLAAWFLFYYLKGKDKRKLVFAIAFLLAGVSYVYLAIGYHNIESMPLLWSNLYHWSTLPMMVAFLFVVGVSLLKIKDFDLLCKILLVIVAFSFILVFLPVSIVGMFKIIRYSMGIVVIISSSYLLVKTRDPSSLLFLLSMICFIIAGVTLVRDMEYFSIFSYLMAHVFLTLIFVTAPTSGENEEQDISSYFSLKKNLKNAKIALQESEKKYKRIVENTSDVIMLTQPDGIISYVSPSCEKVLEYNAKELVGQQPWIIHPDDLEKVKKIHFQALKGESDTDFEYRIKTKAGEIKWVSHSFSPIFADDKLQMIVSSIRDTTDRKRAEEKLKEKLDELERYKNVTVDRELRLIELKKKIKQLEEKLKSEER